MIVSLKTTPGIAGIAAENIPKDDVGPILAGGIIPDTDPLFHTVAEQLLSPILRAAGIQDWSIPTVSQLLITLDFEGRTTLLANEFSMVALGELIGRSKKKGEALARNDIGDISAVYMQLARFPDILLDVDNHRSFMALFSHGWHRSIVFDLTRALPSTSSKAQGSDRPFSDWLTHTYLTLLQTARTEWKNNTWDQVLQFGWYPFLSLSHSTIAHMRELALHGSERDSLLRMVRKDIIARKGTIEKRWNSTAHMSSHQKVIHTLLDRYLNGDVVGACHIAYPQIEGVLRSLHGTVADEPWGKVRDSVKAISAQIESHRGQHSIYYPSRFAEFLERRIFPSFDPDTPGPATRHTLAHGVVDPEELDEESAVIGILTLDQIALALPGMPNNSFIDGKTVWTI